MQTTDITPKDAAKLLRQYDENSPLGKPQLAAIADLIERQETRIEKGNHTREEKTMRVQVDVWGGEGSQDLVARYALDLPREGERLAAELADGYLINLLAVDKKHFAEWRDTEAFDHRVSRGQA